MTIREDRKAFHEEVRALHTVTKQRDEARAEAERYRLANAANDKLARENFAEVERLREALTAVQGEAYLGTMDMGDEGPNALEACENVINVCLEALGDDR